MTGKPTVEDLGIEVDAQQWQRSGDGEGSLEVAFVPGADGAADWVLMRVAGDPQGRILVYDRHSLDIVLLHQLDDIPERRVPCDSAKSCRHDLSHFAALLMDVLRCGLARTNKDT